MANSQACSFVLEITAGENIPANRFVDFDNKVLSSGGKAKGVSISSISSGNIGAIAIIGIVTVETGDSFFSGDEVCCGANGKAVPQGGTDPVNGYALEDGDPGDFIQIMLK